MCTGRSPFRGDSLAAVIKRVTEDTPRSIAEVNSEIPAWLSDVIQRLLEKHPDLRYQTAAEVSEVLAGHLANVQQPTRSAPTSRPEPQRTMRRLPLLIARVVGYVVLAAIGCVVAMGSVWGPTVLFLAVLFLVPSVGSPSGEANATVAGRGATSATRSLPSQPSRSWRESNWVSRLRAAMRSLGYNNVRHRGDVRHLGTDDCRHRHADADLVGGRSPFSPRTASAGQSRPGVPVSPAQSRPQRILVWLAIVCLTMFLLVPICAVGVGLLVPLLARQKCR